MPGFATEAGGIVVRMRLAGIPVQPPVAVYFGDRPAEVRGVFPSTPTDAELVVLAPPSRPGRVSIRVTTGRRIVSLPDAFEYVPSLRVESVEPARVAPDGGTTVTVRGAGFDATIQVYVDGTRISSVSRLSSSELTFEAPRHAEGRALVELVNFAGMAQEERAGQADALDYRALAAQFRAVILARLVDLRSGMVVDSRLIPVGVDLKGMSDAPAELIWESIAPGVTNALPLHLIQPSSDRLWLIPRARAANPRTSAAFGRALSATLRGRGFAVVDTLERSDLLGEDELAQLAFGASPLRWAPNLDLVVGKGVTKLLTYSVPIELTSEDPTSDAFATLDLLERRFEETRSLAEGLPEAAASEATLLVRVDNEPGEPAESWETEIAEEAVTAGVLTRMPVVEKLGAPTVKPRWLYPMLRTPSDPLAYTSWNALRAALPGATSVLLYRSEPDGLYMRLVDSQDGIVRWSGHLIDPDRILSGDLDPSLHDLARDAAAGTDWIDAFGPDARVWLSPSGSAPIQPFSQAHDGLVSALTDAGVAVVEPMATTYRVPAPSDDAAYVAAVRALGATHLLEYAFESPATPENPTPVQWTFRVIDAASGREIRRWTAHDENAQPGAAANGSP